MVTKAIAVAWVSMASMLIVGCIRDTRPTHERGAGIGGHAPEVLAPEKDRCLAHAKTENARSCNDARAVAQLFARKLSIGDRVCLENGIGEEPDENCAVRAQAVDVGLNRVLIEIRAARPDSKYFQQVGSQVWFEEGALVDLYLAERGY